MISIVIKDQTYSKQKSIIFPRGHSNYNGFYNLNFQSSATGGYTSASFTVGSLPMYAQSNIDPYDAIDIWDLGKKIWTGRISNNIQRTDSGEFTIECEGIGVAWGRDMLATYNMADGDGKTNNNTASEIYEHFLGNFPINLLNTEHIIDAGSGLYYDRSEQIGDTTWEISQRDWKETSYEQIFNDVNNFEGFWWGVGLFRSNVGMDFNLARNANTFYYTDFRSPVVSVTWRIPYYELNDIELNASMEEYANYLRIRYGYTDPSPPNDWISTFEDIGDGAGGGDETAMALSQDAYTPGSQKMISFSIENQACEMTTSDAQRIAGAWINKRKTEKRPYPGPWAKGSATVQGSRFFSTEIGGNQPASCIKAGHLLQIQGILVAQPELSGIVDDTTTFLITATDYDADNGVNQLTLNDEIPDISAHLNRIGSIVKAQE